MPGRAQRRAETRPGEAAQQRQRVDQDQSLDPLRMALGEDQTAAGAPVVGEELDGLDLQRVEQLRDEISMGVDRVLEVTALDRVAETWQVRREATGVRQELGEVRGAGRRSVQVEHRDAVDRRAPVEHWRIVEFDPVLLDGHP